MKRNYQFEKEKSISRFNRLNNEELKDDFSNISIEEHQINSNSYQFLPLSMIVKETDHYFLVRGEEGFDYHYVAKNASFKKSDTLQSSLFENIESMDFDDEKINNKKNFKDENGKDSLNYNRDEKLSHELGGNKDQNLYHSTKNFEQDCLSFNQQLFEFEESMSSGISDLKNYKQFTHKRSLNPKFINFLNQKHKNHGKKFRKVNTEN